MWALSIAWAIVMAIVLTAACAANMAIIVWLRYRRLPDFRHDLLKSARYMILRGWLPLYLLVSLLMCVGIAGVTGVIGGSMAAIGMMLFLFGSIFMYFAGDRLPWLGFRSALMVAELRIWRSNFGFGVFSNPSKAAVA